MSRNDPSRLFFGKEDVISTSVIIPRLIRAIFYGLGITNDTFNMCYRKFFGELYHGDVDRVGSKISADRGTISDKNKLTFVMFHTTLRALGYDIRSCSVTIVHRETDKEYTFSTTDSVEVLDKIVKENDIMSGTDSF